jgi:hypothetical protein
MRDCAKISRGIDTFILLIVAALTDPRYRCGLENSERAVH